MAQRDLKLVHDASDASGGERLLLPNAVLGTLIFVLTEVMLFAGLISAFAIVRAAAVQWPPPGQPRLPAAETALNTAALLLSGAALWWSGRLFSRDRPRARAPLLAALFLGGFFVLFQGIEWAALIREGLTITSSTHGSFFYLIVGAHALHAVAAIGILVWVWALLARRRLRPGTFAAARIFWYFVVGVWPILYVQIYL